MKDPGPLERRTPPARRTPMPRARPRTPKPAKASRPQDVGEKEGRRLVRERSSGWCEIGIPGVCLGRTSNFSHRVGAAHGGTYSPVNGADACGSGVTGCHGWATHNRTVARERGWILFSTDDPASTPFEHAWLGLVLLRVDGTVELVEEEAA